MPSLSPSTNIGGSASSLIRSANSLQNQIQAYNDSLQAYQYQNSAYTDDAYTAYKDYLQKRIDALQSTGSVTDAQKALTLTKTLEAATHSNISASITRENIQIMSGQASLQDKYNLVSQQYVRAVNNGDLTLAQSLESQAYSISQSIQYQAQQRATAASTYAAASASSTAKGQESVATSLAGDLVQFNKDFAGVGQKSQDKTLQAFVKSITPQLEALGISLPKGAAPNYYDVVEGVAHAIYQAHSLAYMATGDQSYLDKANAIVQGDTNFKTLGGSMSIQDIQQAATALANGQIAYNATTGGFGKEDINSLVPKGSTASGFKLIPGQGVQVQSSPNAFVAASPALTAQLGALHLKFSAGNNTSADQGQQVQVTAQSPQWLKKFAKNGTLLNTFETQHKMPDGTTVTNLTFKGDSSDGPGSSVYTVVTDSQGRKALYESSQLGDFERYADVGYGSTPGVGKNGEGFFAQVGHELSSGIKGAASSLFGLFSGHASAQDLISSGQATQFQIAQANAAAAAAMLAYKPAPLPQISVPRPSAPPAAPAPPHYNLIQPASFPVAPRTVNPQPSAPSGANLGVSQGNVQGGGGFRLQ